MDKKDPRYQLYINILKEELVPAELQKNYTAPVTRGQVAQMIINLLLFTTIFTEIIGPALTRYGIRRAGEDHSSE